MAIIYVRGWAGEEDFPIPPQIVDNNNAFPAYDGEEFAVQFDYSWYGNDPTAAAFARVIWRDENDNVISTTEWPLPATVGFVHVAYSVIAPAGVAIGRLQFEGPDIGGPEDRPGRYVGFQRPDVRRVLITADSVPGTALLDGAVTPPKIADLAVTTPKLADGAVMPGKIGVQETTDLDLAVETGCYYFPSYAANQPEPDDPINGFVVVINTGVVKMQRANLGYMRTGRTWIRYAGSNGVWLAWERDESPEKLAGVDQGIARGSFVATSDLPAGDFVDTVVNFPSGMFSSTPYVTTSTSQVRISSAVLSVDSSQMTVRVYNHTSIGAGGACRVRWHAIR